MTGPCWHVTEPQNAAAFLAGGSRHQQVAQDYSCSVGVAEGQQEALASSGGGASRNLGTWKLRFKVDMQNWSKKLAWIITDVCLGECWTTACTFNATNFNVHLLKSNLFEVGVHGEEGRPQGPGRALTARILNFLQAPLTLLQSICTNKAKKGRQEMAGAHGLRETIFNEFCEVYGTRSQEKVIARDAG
eukprot:scaffold125308_cov14-Tisochrysis_lutea.AAC.2